MSSEHPGVNTLCETMVFGGSSVQISTACVEGKSNKEMESDPGGAPRCKDYCVTNEKSWNYSVLLLYSTRILVAAIK